MVLLSFQEITDVKFLERSRFGLTQWLVSGNVAKWLQSQVLGSVSFLDPPFIRIIHAQQLHLVPGISNHSINKYCLLIFQQALRIQAKSLPSWSFHSSGGCINWDKLGYAV